MKKNANQTKSRIVTAAWKLFYQYGYENTTIDDIVDAAQTSKGSFYHYFESKDALLSSLSYLFDEKYKELEAQMDPDMSPVDKLLMMNQEVFLMIVKEARSILSALAEGENPLGGLNDKAARLCHRGIVPVHQHSQAYA